MKESYIAKDFRKTAAQCFPEKADALCAAFDTRLNELRAEYADASDALRQHLESQIMPGIAAYETLQSVMPKDEALGTVHGYVEALSRQYHKYFVALLRLLGCTACCRASPPRRRAKTSARQRALPRQSSGRTRTCGAST